eukprot:TCONS_00028730-protein
MHNEHNRFQDDNIQGLLAIQTKPPDLMSSTQAVTNLLMNTTLQSDYINSPISTRGRGRGRGSLRPEHRQPLRGTPTLISQTRSPVLRNRNTQARGTLFRGAPNRGTNRGTPNRTSFDRRKSFEDRRKSIEDRRKSNEVRRSSADGSSSSSKTTTSQCIENSKEAPLTDMEKEAMNFDLPQLFFERIKPLTMTQVALDAALDYTRKEMDKKRGGNTPLSNLKFKEGNQACRMCRENFKNADEYYAHNKSFEHKELEHLCKVRKEQARLILQRKITRLSKNFKEASKEEQSQSSSQKSSLLSPKGENSKKPISNGSVSPPDKDMALIFKAENELNLKPTTMELDPYILGVYESVMKEYWPSPKTELYCRVCNYQEFKSMTDFEEHKKMPNHIDRQACYDDAFCLYCQIHSGNATSMREHEKSIEHEEIKNRMDKAKQCAIEHWHRINNFELPEHFKKEKEKAEQQIGTKRSAPYPPEKSDQSPTKRQNLSSPTSTHKTPLPPPPTPPAVKSQAARTIEVLVSKNNKKSTESKNNDNQQSSESSDSEKRTDFKPAPNLRRIPKLHDQPLLPREKVWFVPVSAVMCVACQVFVEENKQKAHCREIIHNTNVIKFKRQLNM